MGEPTSPCLGAEDRPVGDRGAGLCELCRKAMCGFRAPVGWSHVYHGEEGWTYNVRNRTTRIGPSAPVTDGRQHQTGTSTRQWDLTDETGEWPSYVPDGAELPPQPPVEMLSIGFSFFTFATGNRNGCTHQSSVSVRWTPRGARSC
jgi:hypothetical protein